MRSSLKLPKSERWVAELLQRFVFDFCKSQSFIDEMVTQATGASYPAVSDKIVRSALVPAYTYEEQCEIRKVLDTVFNIIEKRKEEIQNFDDLIKARFVEMFGDPKRNPFGWEMITVRDIVASCEAGWSGNGTLRKKRDGEIAVLKVSAVTKGVFIPEVQFTEFSGRCSVLERSLSDAKRPLIFNQVT